MKVEAFLTPADIPALSFDILNRYSTIPIGVQTSTSNMINMSSKFNQDKKVLFYI